MTRILIFIYFFYFEKKEEKVLMKTLSELDPEYFNKQKISAFEFVEVHIPEMPLKPELVPQISRAKFSRCQLKKLPKGLSGYHFLKVLDLSENEITDVEEEEVKDFIALQYLDLSLNNLTRMTPAMPATIIQLDLSYNPSIDVENVFSLNLPKLEVLKLIYCHINELPDIIPPWSNSIKSLSLDGNNLKNIPKCVTKFPNLDELILFGNEITDARLPEDMHPLKTLNLAMNPIDKIDAETKFEVQTLYLSNIKIKEFPVPQLQPKCLRVLMLSGIGLPGTLNVTLPPQIAYLDLSRNSIDALSPEFVRSCRTATVINLSCNNLVTIPDEFPENISFSQILLSRNKLKELPQTIMQSRSLERFVVSHNELEHMPSFKFPQLRELDVSFNKLVELPDSFDSCSFLVTVNVSFNKLTDLPKSMAHCRRMLDLVAAHNEFKLVPKSVNGLASLRLLVLSMNHLTALPPALGVFFFLKTLDLANNHFIQIPKEISSLRSLKTLSLSHNLIATIDASIILPQSLTYLDLSFNLIENLPIINLTNLTALCISCNKIKTRDLTKNNQLHFYSDFGNQIESDSTDYTQLTNLRVLEGFNNSIETPALPSGVHAMTPAFTSKWSFGYSSMLGPRPTMEDAISIVSKSPDEIMLALFDGHAGFGAACSSTSFMQREFMNMHDQTEETLPEAITEAFVNVQKSLYQERVDGGCTCAMSIIHNNTVFTASIGDSRIVRVKKDSFQRVTVDHKPLIPTEFSRLKKVDLGVTMDGRIRRRLGVARSFGDFWCPKYEGLFVKPTVSSFSIEDDDIGLIVACDGLWDVLDDDEAANIVRESKTAQDAAVTLKNCCLALASFDNFSVIVLKFKEGGFDTTNTVERIPIVEIPAEEPIFPVIAAGTPRRANRMRR